MMAVIMNGKLLSNKIKQEIREEINFLEIKPGLAVIIVGNDPSSQIYVKGKIKDCNECGIKSFEFSLNHNSKEEDILKLIDELNNREDIHGIICQLPLPEGINQQHIIQAISPEKDVDCFHFENLGRVINGNYGFLPCTPQGVMYMLDYYNITITGKHVVIVNHSNIVGKPQAMLLTNRDATVSIAHKATYALSSLTRLADILITAVGKKNFIKQHMVKPGAVVIDVAIGRDNEGKIYGDVAFDEVLEVCSHITPVPGGIGLMTRAMLMRNTLIAAKRALGYDYSTIVRQDDNKPILASKSFSKNY
ncbi:MAG: bifunctional 5,10-methylene-tetrahydrofolate dehydrogenase/5,10-methylene-tetrahydrofolate cyclohydrolase [Defluviitaleaceae bacterium]|nr:bifunctional 5,10-methylene-tetrahydrofolate dehydrogenase/5,10-methylene-tetrahydrofolate cyclohydrolase [Defluviitaleaceae bacterium]